MNFGERLYNLRKEKNISQGELADKLEVSRQSVSKWENNISTPDLDKIIKISEIFSVSIDSLVNGYEVSCEQGDEIVNATHEHKEMASTKNPTSKKGRIVAGIILSALGLQLLVLISVFCGFLVGLEVSFLFLACGFICFIFKSHAWLWCVWVVHEIFSLYILNSTSISFRLVYLTFSPSINGPLQIIIGWILLAVMGFMMALTVCTFYKKPLKIKWSHLIALICIVAVVYLLIPIIYQSFVIKASSSYFDSRTYSMMLNLLQYAIDRIRFFFGVIVICYLARVIYPNIE